MGLDNEQEIRWNPDLASCSPQEKTEDPYLWLEDVEGEDWVWKGSSCLHPEYRKCLLNLSRGGADAVVIREFDSETRAFVDDEFFVAEAKTETSWIDEDTVFIGSNFGDDSLTDSGYARTSRLWKRGVPIEDGRIRRPGYR